MGLFYLKMLQMFLKKNIKKSDMSPTETFPFLTIGEVTRKLSRVVFDPKMQI